MVEPRADAGTAKVTSSAPSTSEPPTFQAYSKVVSSGQPSVTAVRVARVSGVPEIVGIGPSSLVYSVTARVDAQVRHVPPRVATRDVASRLPPDAASDTVTPNE